MSATTVCRGLHQVSKKVLDGTTAVNDVSDNK